MRLIHLKDDAQMLHRVAAITGGQMLSHAYILSGGQAGHMRALALDLAMGALCTGAGDAFPCGCCQNCKKVLSESHPDIKVICGEKEKAISIAQIRQMRSDVHIMPNEGARKVYILERAHLMQPPAQNALLKVIEDGPPYAMFLFLAENAGGLLDTVRSRCHEIIFHPAQEDVCADEAVCTLAKEMICALAARDEFTLLVKTVSASAWKGKEFLLLCDEMAREISISLRHDTENSTLQRGAVLLQQMRRDALTNANPAALLAAFCAEVFSGQSRFMK